MLHHENSMQSVQLGSDPLANLGGGGAASESPAAASYPYAPPAPTAPQPPAAPAAPSGARRLREEDVPRGEDGLRQLAAAGQWRAVASLGQTLLSSSHPVDVLLRLRWFRITALLKLREHKAAEHEMSLLGDLRGQQWQYERYPALFTGKKGSMIPFSLSLLHATMPACAGDHSGAQQRLYALLTTIQARIEAGDPDKPDLLLQQQQVVLTLANVCCATGDYPLALVHLQQLVDASGADLVPAPPPPAGTPLSAGWQLLSMLGRLQLQVGNLDGAEDAFSRLECLVMDADDCAVVRLNRGLLGVAQGAFDVAAAEFETVLQLEPGNAVAANNRAVCHLYACKLQDAIKSLESFLKADPKARTHQSLVANLAALYQMTDGATASKQALERIVVEWAPDDFDVAALAPAV